MPVNFLKSYEYSQSRVKDSGGGREPGGREESQDDHKQGMFMEMLIMVGERRKKERARYMVARIEK